MQKRVSAVACGGSGKSSVGSRGRKGRVSEMGTGLKVMKVRGMIRAWAILTCLSAAADIERPPEQDFGEAANLRGELQEESSC